MYTWSGMRKLGPVEIEKRQAEDGLVGLFWLYPDDTEGLIEEPVSMETVEDMILCGVEIGEEKEQ